MQDENDMQFNAEDFERYYSGRMTEQEMHALEKAALEDPFLGDAFEGYRFTPTPVQDVRELKERLQQRRKHKTVWLSRGGYAPLLKVAAILILVAGFSWMIYKKNADQPVKEVMLARENAKASTDNAAATQPLAQPDDSIQPVSGNKPDVAAVKKTKDGFASVLNRNDSTGAGTIAMAKDQPSTDYYQSTQVPVAEKDMQLEEVVTAKKANKFQSKEVTASVSHLQLQNANNVKGRIVDNAGNPIPFAVVIAKGKNAGLVADKSGEFNYQVKDTSTQLVVNANGYEQRTFDINNSTAVQDIVLQNHMNSPREAIINNAPLAKAKQNFPAVPVAVNSLPKIAVSNAVPLAGWEELNTYINDSLQRTAALKSSVKKGHVILSFDVNHNAEAVKIKIRESLCNECNPEAIQIIKSQKWKLNNTKKKAEATIQF